ncbi:MAG: DNA repair protein RecO [Aquificaceae bacterium]
MAAKGKFLILRRFRAGDSDVMLKAYGPYGMVKVFVQGGYVPEKGLLGYLEPFNLLSIVYQQSGEVLFLKDIVEVQFLSYLSMDYSTYIWMNSVVAFMERWFLQYDPDIFNLVLRYLTLKTKNHDIFLIKFKLEFLRDLGLYKDSIFEENLRKVANLLLEETSFVKLERLRISKVILLDIDKTIEDHLSNSL